MAVVSVFHREVLHNTIVELIKKMHRLRVVHHVCNDVLTKTAFTVTVTTRDHKGK